ncbi:MAG: hypothetical protein ACUVRS_08815 [Armatimonadota bacterium]
MALECKGCGFGGFVKAVVHSRYALVATVLLFVATTILAVYESGLLSCADKVPSYCSQLIKIHVGTERALNTVVQKEK